METKLDVNDPYLWSAQGKKRKEELIFEFFVNSPKLQTHAISCPVMKYGNYETDCLVCQKFSAMINILIESENNRNSGKLDVKSMVGKGIVEYMIYGDGIKFR